jgi:hypothetical protein
VLAPLCTLASPYGFGLVGYYRLMLLHPPLADFVTEWRPPTVGAATLGFFMTAFGVTALWSRHGRMLTSFERWALVLLLIAALSAVRSAIWFELAAAVSLPKLLDAAWPPGPPPTLGVRRVNLVLAPLAVVAAGLVIALSLARPVAWLEGTDSSAAAAKVAAAAGPHGIVLPDDRHADWLLWREPSLVGRVAYDVRFELFDRRQLQQIASLQRGSRPAWLRCGVTASVVTFATPAERRLLAQQGVFAAGSRLLLSSPGFTAVAQPARGVPCRL